MTPTPLPVSPLRRLLVAAAIAALAACSSAVGPGDAGDASVTVTCARRICAQGETCCYVTGTCVDPGAPGSCSVPPDAARPVNVTTALCASNTDCAANERCEGFTCLGVGFCNPNPDTCLAGPNNRPPHQPVCGCDGVTYPNPCEAAMRRVRLATLVPCGEGTPGTVDGGTSGPIGCGVGGACPDGTQCCDITNWCVPVGCTTCCRAAPPGTRVPCASDSECLGGETCGGVLGCDTPAGCVPIRTVCSGVSAPVCGCDGQTYVNECYARQARTKIRAEGACP